METTSTHYMEDASETAIVAKDAYETAIFASMIQFLILLQDAYETAIVAKYGDDTTCHPLLDNETWLDVTGGVKKGKIFGFANVSDPESFLAGTSSTITSREVVYERVREEMHEEMDAKATEMEAKLQETREEMDAKAAEMDLKVAAIDAKQKHIDERYQAMEKMFAAMQNVRGN